MLAKKHLLFLLLCSFYYKHPLIQFCRWETSGNYEVIIFKIIWFMELQVRFLIVCCTLMICTFAALLLELKISWFYKMYKEYLTFFVLIWSQLINKMNEVQLKIRCSCSLNSYNGHPFSCRVAAQWQSRPKRSVQCSRTL